MAPGAIRSNIFNGRIWSRGCVDPAIHEELLHAKITQFSLPSSSKYPRGQILSIKISPLHHIKALEHSEADTGKDEVEKMITVAFIHFLCLHCWTDQQSAGAPRFNAKNTPHLLVECEVLCSTGYRVTRCDPRWHPERSTCNGDWKARQVHYNKSHNWAEMVILALNTRAFRALLLCQYPDYIACWSLREQILCFCGHQRPKSHRRMPPPQGLSRCPRDMGAVSRFYQKSDVPTAY